MQKNYSNENRENIDFVNVDNGQQRNEIVRKNEIIHLSPDLAACGIKMTGVPRAPKKSLAKMKKLNVDLNKVKRKLRLSWDDEAELSNEVNVGEFHLLGTNVENKLKFMDPVQAFYAESIINQVLKCGMLNSLSPNTGICNNECDIREYQISLSTDCLSTYIHSPIAFGESQGLVVQDRNTRRNVNNDKKSNISISNILKRRI